jgi:hypothetical protein
VDAESTGVELRFFREKEEHDGIAFKAQIGAQLARAFVFRETVGNCVEDDGDVDVAVGRQLISCAQILRQIQDTHAHAKDSHVQPGAKAGPKRACVGSVAHWGPPAWHVSGMLA